MLFIIISKNLHVNRFLFPILFSGNPFSSDFIEDPGLRKQIFNATIPSEEEKDENKGYVFFLPIIIVVYVLLSSCFFLL